MSRKLSVVLVGVFASVAVAAGFMQGCGGGSSSSSNVAVCQKVCDKALECVPDAGSIGQQAHSDCLARCSAAGSTTCSNESAIVSAANACLAMSCDAFLTCQVPACERTTGTGGSTGTGGTSGTADCSACVKADACCAALANGDTTNCTFTVGCTNPTGGSQNQQTIITACQGVLNTAHNVPNAPAACLQ